jgi:hypothetical protein
MEITIPLFDFLGFFCPRATAFGASFLVSVYAGETVFGAATTEGAA